jgi:hypothetical protein
MIPVFPGIAPLPEELFSWYCSGTFQMDFGILLGTACDTS